jgi:lysozyme
MFGLSDPECPIDLPKLTASLKVREGTGPMQGNRFMPYRDSTGHLTIAYGVNLDAGLDIDEGDWLLQHRLAGAISQAQGEDWWPHVAGNDARARAMCELVFNMGAAGVRTFAKAVAALLDDDFQTASAEFLNSLWARQVGNRAEILAGMIASGADGPNQPAA